MTLVERLRARGAFLWNGGKDDRLAAIEIHEAADRIDELERELAEARKPAEIRTDPGGALDEICAPGVHLEQMADNSWFLSVGEVNVWLNAKGKITATYEDNRDAARTQERT